MDTILEVLIDLGGLDLDPAVTGSFYGIRDSVVVCEGQYWDYNQPQVRGTVSAAPYAPWGQRAPF